MNDELRTSWDERIRPVWFWLLVVAGLAGSFAVLMLMQRVLAPLLALASYHPVELQFAWTRDAAIEIMRGYELRLPALLDFLALDGFYPLFYGMLFFGTTALVRRALKEGVWRKPGTAALIFCLAAPVCDWLENGLTLHLFNNLDTVPAWCVFGLTLFAEIKWLLLLGVVVWLVGGIIGILRSRGKR